MTTADKPAAVEAELARKRRQLIVGFGVGIAVCLLAASFFYSKIPHTHQLMVVPEVLLLLALVLPILLAQSLVPGRAGLISAAGSCLVWVAGIVASFLIKPTTNVIYVPDALLLLGFAPLLYHWRFSWPWFVFGGFNFGIGVFLGAIERMSDGLFPPPLVVAKHHLGEYHPSITWWIVGGLAIGFGLGRLIKNVYKQVAARKS